MPKKTGTKFNVLDNHTLSKAIKTLKECEKHKKSVIDDYESKVKSVEAAVKDSEEKMSKAALSGDSSLYVEAKQQHEQAVEQLDFLKSYSEQNLNKMGRVTEKEANAFYDEIRAGFKAICDDLDKSLIADLEAMRERLAEVEQLGILLSDACTKMTTDYDPKDRYGAIFGTHDFRTSSIGSLLSENVFDHPEYVKISGVEMKGTTFFGERVFSDDMVREGDRISAEIFSKI